MADGFGGMPISAEMNTFEGKISCDERIVPGPELEHGAIVPDSGDDLSSSATARGLGHSANSSNQRFFRKGHGRKPIYAREASKIDQPRRVRTNQSPQITRGHRGALSRKVSTVTCPMVTCGYLPFRNAEGTCGVLTGGIEFVTVNPSFTQSFSEPNCCKVLKLQLESSLRLR